MWPRYKIFEFHRRYIMPVLVQGKVSLLIRWRRDLRLRLLLLEFFLGFGAGGYPYGARRQHIANCSGDIVLIHSRTAAQRAGGARDDQSLQGRAQGRNAKLRRDHDERLDRLVVCDDRGQERPGVSDLVSGKKLRSDGCVADAIEINVKRQPIEQRGRRVLVIAKPFIESYNAHARGHAPREFIAFDAYFAVVHNRDDLRCGRGRKTISHSKHKHAAIGLRHQPGIKDRPTKPQGFRKIQASQKPVVADTERHASSGAGSGRQLRKASSHASRAGPGPARNRHPQELGSTANNAAA